MSQSSEGTKRRCPECDAVVEPDSSHCIMCGAPTRRDALEDDMLRTSALGVTEKQQEEVVDASLGNAMAPAEIGENEVESSAPVISSVLVERRSRITAWMTAALVIIVALAGVAILQNPTELSLSMFPTPTPTPEIEAEAPRAATMTSAEVASPTPTPTITSTPMPTETPRPARPHLVSSGETLFGLALRYDVTADSIATENNLAPDAVIQVDEQLMIPWPTATPPLVPVEVVINGQTVVADPRGCKMVEIKGGDTLFAIASREKVELSALLAVNRLTEQSLLQPGDTVCIPTMIRGGVLPPTPGPSPTPTEIPPPAGPALLFPVDQAYYHPGDVVTLQWVTVKDLSADEWYMVELTDLGDLDQHPRRAFTRQSSYHVPEEWLPEVEEAHLLRWRVAIVSVTGRRSDGEFTYKLVGDFSEPSLFRFGVS